MAGPTLANPRITLIGRPGCHLCDLARQTVTAVAEETGCGMREVDYDLEPDLPLKYGDLLPVVLVDGLVHDTWRVDAQRLRAALAASPPAPRREGDCTTRWWHRFTGGR